jgi:hypothetical protein
MKAAAIALCVLLLAGCSPHVCPDYLMADGLTVDADAFVHAHSQHGACAPPGHLVLFSTRANRGPPS